MFYFTVYGTSMSLRSIFWNGQSLKSNLGRGYVLLYMLLSVLVVLWWCNREKFCESRW